MSPAFQNNIAPSSALTVSQLNSYVKFLFEGDLKLANITVEGEITDFRRQFSSGHLYFSLKDEQSRLRCVMFRSAASKLAFNPENGARVTATGRVTVYEANGEYQLYVNSMRPSGAGELALALEQLKRKLAAEGLFDPAKKRPLPAFPRRIGVITSASGAAFHDIINVLTRRYPLCEVVFCPAAVQGPLCPPENVRALRRLNREPDLDLIIIGRGGGSAEDLMGYNNEALVREVAASRIPVVSAVGHEIDFTLCDLAADRRAPTPSAAAELSSPDIDDLKLRIDNMINAGRNFTLTYIGTRLDRHADLLSRMRALSPAGIIERRGQDIALLNLRARAAAAKRVDSLAAVQKANAEKLAALDPEKIFRRGYTAVRNEAGRITSVTALKPGDGITLEFFDGTANATVNDIRRIGNGQ